jgi:hypothetical protein
MLLNFNESDLRKAVLESLAGFLEWRGVCEGGDEKKRPETVHDFRYFAR